jgi:hypothetical protein
LQVLTFRCGFAAYDGIRQLLEVDAGPAGCVTFAINSCQTFSATLTRDFMGSATGEEVDVMVDLLNEGTVKIGKVLLPAQLVLGCPVTNEDELRVMMTGKLPPHLEGKDEDGEGDQ